MGRTAIKKVKESKTTVLNSENEVAKLLKIVVAVIILFVIFYLITVFVTKKKNTEEQPVTTIQYEEIVVGMLLTQSAEEYYVLAHFDEDNYLGVYGQYFDIYETKHSDALPYYTINLDNAFNASYVGDEENLMVTSIDNLRINKPTLFRVKKGKIVETYSGSDKITNYLEEISKK